MSIPDYWRPEWRPTANPQAVVRGPSARFTVLTERLIRLEYSPTAEFEDRPSQAFWFREQPRPEFSLNQTEGALAIETPYLRLEYRGQGEGFSAENLSITLKQPGLTWHYGDSADGNLLGTTRTLDQVSGATRLEPGLLSRDGWVVVNDSRSLVFNDAGWLEKRAAPPEALDLYFFGHAHDYAAALRDFRRIAGAVPLIPRWMLGNWWSRYWEYTQTELTELMQAFRAHQIPLAVCIVDMDWHIVQNPHTSGWTGYTWNRDLFPDPDAFIAGLHAQGLRTALNLHPASGVHPHEAAYPEMARRLGLDPVTRAPVPFDLADPAFATAYFEVLHHPEEARGADFWWIDWQQGALSRLTGLDPLWWLNHLHFYDLGRDGQRRPVIFSRWGGLGNHRYPIGFSGDTHVTWESLAFQPVFTATAANVGYGWWSHDIGGHMLGAEDGELYARWVQFGLFSPILRLHSTKMVFHERRPWGYDAEVFRVTRAAMQWRHALLPYLYTMAWRDHAEGQALIRPIYHTHPDHAIAYTLPQQYWCGDDFIVAPHTDSADSHTRLSRQTVWLPEGDWYHFFSGEHYPGGQTHAVYGALADIPAFVRAGAIIPTGPLLGWGGLSNPDALVWRVFAGADHAFTLYEDDGETTAYLQSDCALTEVRQTWDGQTLTLRLLPVQGAPRHIPAARAHTFRIAGLAAPETVHLLINDRPTPAPWSYDAEHSWLEIGSLRLEPTDSLEIRLTARLYRPDRRQERVFTLLRAFRMQTFAKQAIYARIQELLTTPGLLDGYQLYLAPSQRQALEETARGIVDVKP